MTKVLDQINEMQDNVVEFVSSIREPLTKSVSTAVEFVVSRLPEVPSVGFADKIPTAREVVDSQFAFAGKMLDANHEIAVAVADAAAPLGVKLLDRKPVKKARKAAVKAA